MEDPLLTLKYTIWYNVLESSLKVQGLREMHVQ